MNVDSKGAARVRQRRRLSAALRKNLKRRKAQAKGRAAPSQASGDQSHDSAGIADKSKQQR
jgi:hypothetical protein